MGLLSDENLKSKTFSRDYDNYTFNHAVQLYGWCHAFNLDIHSTLHTFTSTSLFILFDYLVFVLLLFFQHNFDFDYHVIPEDSW